MDLSQLGPQVDSQTRSAAELARPPANEDTAQRNLGKKQRVAVQKFRDYLKKKVRSKRSVFYSNEDTAQRNLEKKNAVQKFRDYLNRKKVRSKS